MKTGKIRFKLGTKFVESCQVFKQLLKTDHFLSCYKKWIILQKGVLIGKTDLIRYNRKLK